MVELELDEPESDLADPLDELPDAVPPSDELLPLEELLPFDGLAAVDDFESDRESVR